ncbi:hypothetical protein COCON_G00019470, partial [Conger conger]
MFIFFSRGLLPLVISFHFFCENISPWRFCILLRRVTSDGCLLVDLDVPRLPQDLFHDVDDPPLMLELIGLASPRWTVEEALSRHGRRGDKQASRPAWLRSTPRTGTSGHVGRNLSNQASSKRGKPCQLIWEQRAGTAVSRSHHQREPGPRSLEYPGSQSGVQYLSWPVAATWILEPSSGGRRTSRPPRAPLLPN